MGFESESEDVSVSDETSVASAEKSEVQQESGGHGGVANEEKVLSQDDEGIQGSADVPLDGEERPLDKEEPVSSSAAEETKSPLGFGVSNPPPLLEVETASSPAPSGHDGVSDSSGPPSQEEDLGLGTVSDVFDMDDREMLALEEAAYGDAGGPFTTTTDNLLFVGDMFLALILGCIGASIFGKFLRVYV